MNHAFISKLREKKPKPKEIRKRQSGTKTKIKKKKKQQIVEYINREENTQGSSRVGSLMGYKSSC